MSRPSSEGRNLSMFEILERRQLLCGTTGTTPTSSIVSAAPAIVVRPNITPSLGTYAGDLLTGSTIDGAPVTAQYKLVLKSYNATTGKLTGTVYVDDVVVEAHDYGNFNTSFSAVAHLTSGGGFDLHVTGNHFDVKVKGDYKRNDTFISGTTTGTLVDNGVTYNLNFSYDLSART